MNWYKLDIEDICKLLDAGLQGHSSNEAAEKLRLVGPNELLESGKKSMARVLLKQFGDVLILILLAAAIISGIVGDLTDTLVILFIIILTIILGFIQEYRAEKAISALKKIAIPQVRVMRDQKSVWVPPSVLVPGDIIFLEAGNTVPADARIIESDNLKIDEAALTGESHSVDKTADSLKEDDLPIGERINMVFRGTFAVFGRGSAMVVATGMQTEIGYIATLLQKNNGLTPLQEKMASFGKKLSILVLLLCGLFFIAGWLRGENIMKTALTGIALAVAAIPEALPAVITISLALAANKMIRFSCLIRKLSAVETLGSVTYICTDKTGTLTRNKMHVESVFVNERPDKQTELKLRKDEEQDNLLLHAFALNNDVVFDNKLPKGDSTEIALLEAAREQNIQTGNWPRIEEIPFDSERKLMTTFHKHNNKLISFTKGAPDILIERCNKSDREESLNHVKEMAGKGYRVLGFAYRNWDVLPEIPNSESSETNLHFLGLAGLIDPPRDEVLGSIAQCKAAGIVPVMITGDHPLTAKVIAQRIGIVSNENDLVLTGQQLSALDDEGLFSKIETIKVYARVSPGQKLRIVNLLQKKGHYVAMTGDGINDAPALKKANIGIAMGSGTDVSKEAADMILLDDDFSTMIKAVKEGRRVYDNILKFIKYIMSTNASELLTLLLGPMIGLPVALLPIHILWLNLSSDGLPALSLSFENAEEDIMKRPPRPPKQSMFSNGRGIHMIWVGILMAGMALLLQSWAIKNGSPWQTMVFNFLCLGQLGHVMAIRSEKQAAFKMSIFSNRLLIAAGLLTLILQFAITFTPFLQPIFKTESLTFSEFVLVGLASLLVYLAVEVRKLILNRFKRQ